MKKISLKDVQNGLKRDEMRVITGGSGGFGPWDKLCNNDWECNAYWGSYSAQCINHLCQHG